jgi:hypothetical protein
VTHLYVHNLYVHTGSWVPPRVSADYDREQSVPLSVGPSIVARQVIAGHVGLGGLYTPVFCARTLDTPRALNGAGKSQLSAYSFVRGFTGKMQGFMQDAQL